MALLLYDNLKPKGGKTMNATAEKIGEAYQKASKM